MFYTLQYMGVICMAKILKVCLLKMLKCIYYKGRCRTYMNIDIYEPSKGGYEAIHSFESWRVAYLRYAEKFDKIAYLERHMETDEIFVLLEGNAELIINENAEHIKMEKNKVYNVRKQVWHNIRVSEDALVLIVENDDTCRENTEYMTFK